MDPAHDPITLVTGFTSDQYACFPPDMTQYTVEVGGDTQFFYEESWSIEKPDSGANGSYTEWYSGGSPYYFSTCPTPAPTVCSENVIVINMFDSYGDGWQGNQLRVLDCQGEVLADGITLAEGSEGTETLCLPTTQFEVQTAKVGVFGSEDTWEAFGPGADGPMTELLAGGMPIDVNNCPSCLAVGGFNVTVVVRQAVLPNGGEIWDPKADAYTVVTAGSGGPNFVTSIIDNNNEPKWDEAVFIGCMDPAADIYFRVPNLMIL